MSRNLFLPQALQAASVILSAGDLPFPDMPAPPYQDTESGRWQFRRIMLPCCPGYFTGPQLVDWTVPTLSRDGVSWMSITPGEVESQMPALTAAHGTVVVCGFGLGMIAYALSALTAVKKVIVVERDEEVLRMGRLYTRFADWPQRDKVELVQHDALTFTYQGADFLYADIWPYYRMDCMVPDMQAMHANIPTPTCGYWGQEIDMVDFAAAQGVRDEDFSQQHIADFCRRHGLPLIGADIPDYPRLCVLAARNPAIGSKRRPIAA